MSDYVTWTQVTEMAQSVALILFIILTWGVVYIIAEFEGINKGYDIGFKDGKRKR